MPLHRGPGLNAWHLLVYGGFNVQRGTPSSIDCMDTWNAVTSRRQVRDFTDEEVSASDLHQILEAGRRAPSGRNNQPWDFIVIDDPDQLSRLSGVWRGASWIAGSAATIALILPIQADERTRLTNRFDLGQTTVQMMITAAGLGVASGQASCDDQGLAQEVLGFPDGYQCALLIALGTAADRPLKPIVNPARRPFDEVVHFGTW